tara:strand:- start:354 stop:542 length:189 start_codon:yes stop_codon:yes gene_type:complete
MVFYTHYISNFSILNYYLNKKNTSFFLYLILAVALSTLQHLYLLVIFDKIFEKKILGKIDNK